MKKFFFLLALLPMVGCSNGGNDNDGGDFGNFTYPEIVYSNLSPGTSGGAAYNTAIGNDPTAYLRRHVLDVVSNLYFSADDPNIPPVAKITVVVDPTYSGVAAKSDDPTVENGYIIRCSPGYITGAQYGTDEKKALEVSGMLTHELTHVYQAQPKGAGTYDGSSEFWVFIEGTADAVRPLVVAYADGDTGASKGGTWRSGYRTTGWFLVWLNNKDKDFLRKFNKTAAEMTTWTWDAAMQSIFGEGKTTDVLWNEYQAR